MKIANRLLTVMVLIGTFSAPAWAEDMVLYATPGYVDALRTKEMMHMIDTNKDGTVSKDEWLAYQGRVFDALDSNHDGFLEPEEFYGKSADTTIPFATIAYTHGLMTKQMFGKIDASQHGKISKQDYLDYQTKIFDMMDTQKQEKLGVADFIVKK
jgi:EF hand